MFFQSVITTSDADFPGSHRQREGFGWAGSPSPLPFSSSFSPCLSLSLSPLTLSPSCSLCSSLLLLFLHSSDNDLKMSHQCPANLRCLFLFCNAPNSPLSLISPPLSLSLYLSHPPSFLALYLGCIKLLGLRMCILSYIATVCVTVFSSHLLNPPLLSQTWNAGEMET